MDHIFTLKAIIEDACHCQCCMERECFRERERQKRHFPKLFGSGAS
jgi:hypothetical protein